MLTVQKLTKNEMKILSVLLKNAGKIVSRDELMDELWQSDEFVDDNTLTVNVNRLRKKLEKYRCKRFHCYKTWYGVFDMRFSTFLKDKWIFLLSQTGIILFLALLLNVMKISNAANALVCICVLFITVGALVLEYNQKNGFYRELYRNLGTLEKKYYISSVTENLDL